MFKNSNNQKVQFQVISVVMEKKSKEKYGSADVPADVGCRTWGHTLADLMSFSIVKHVCEKDLGKITQGAWHAQSKGSQRVGHAWVTNATTYNFQGNFTEE